MQSDHHCHYIGIQRFQAFIGAQGSKVKRSTNLLKNEVLKLALNLTIDGKVLLHSSHPQFFRFQKHRVFYRNGAPGHSLTSGLRYLIYLRRTFFSTYSAVLHVLAAVRRPTEFDG